MNALPDYTFSVAGEGVTIDPATGLLTIATEALLAGVGVVLTARDASGTPTSAFRITVTLADDAEETVSAPAVVGALADLVLTQGPGTHRVETAGAFSGANLAFSVSDGAGAIDAATGALDLLLATLRAKETVTVTATNAGGSAETSFALTIAAPLAAPEATGAPAAQVHALAEGSASISTQAFFSGENLVYALDAAPAGVTIQPGSGLVTIPTGAALAGLVTVSATNASGVARVSFEVTVRAMSTVFSDAATLPDLSFIVTDGAAAPAVTFDSRGFAKLVPATTGRTHGVWAKAGGAGLYRALARWSSSKPAAEGDPAFVFGAGITRTGADLGGVYVGAQRAALAANRGLRIWRYTGAGTAVTELAQATASWAWDTLYWFEVEVTAGRVRARFYPEAGAAPDWMVSAETAPALGGAYGPGAFPLSGVSPTLLLKRLEFSPIQTAADPAAANDADWTLAQATE